MYPEYAEIDGKEYKIDTNFETALKCFDIIEDETIGEYEKAMAIVYLLFDIIPEKNIDLFLQKAVYYLQCGKTIEEQKKQKEDMDFKQDRGYINSSFMSDYHIDLSKENIHFWQFIEFIEGLKEDSILNRVRDLRNYDLSQEKDEKIRNKIREAQKRVALKKNETRLTKEQEESMEKLNKLIGM